MTTANSVAGSPDNRAAPRRQLSLFDSTSIIVGIIVGVGIYESTPLIASNTPGPAWLLGLWVLGGLFALCGAMCYAELATSMPEDGGDYVYLQRAYGRPIGFLFAWSQLWIVRPGNIGVMAYIFARYAEQLWSLGRYSPLTYAASAVIGLTLVNLLGVRGGKWTQNVLTGLKVLGLCIVVAVGFMNAAPAAPVPVTPNEANWGRAMIFILFAYGGWSDMAFVAAEVRDPRRNIVRALVWGTLTVTVVYLLINMAFLHALGFDGLRLGGAVASDVAALSGLAGARQAISGLICVSALGAINGQIFTGARIYYALGKEYRIFAWLGRWNARLDTPAHSLILQALVTLALAIGVTLIWSDSAAAPFERLVIFTTPVFYLFLMLTAFALPVLRWKLPALERPYRVPWYPAPLVCFVAYCGYLLYAAFAYAVQNTQSIWQANEVFWALGLLALGVIVALFEHRRR